MPNATNCRRSLSAEIKVLVRRSVLVRFLRRIMEMTAGPGRFGLGWACPCRNDKDKRKSTSLTKMSSIDKETRNSTTLISWAGPLNQRADRLMLKTHAQQPGQKFVTIKLDLHWPTMSSHTTAVQSRLALSINNNNNNNNLQQQ